LQQIRLPFGKKKKDKHEQAPPVPVPAPSASQSHLGQPIVEEPAASDATPMADDDVESVKQLCSMGFSRSQAVEALEKHGYDVPRALNSLLGAQQ
jgi:epidermal growth factor receptor substrate 15